MKARTNGTFLRVRPLLRDARITVGKRFRARGLPAVLLGVAGIVVAARLPATAREIASLFLAVRREGSCEKKPLPNRALET